MPIHNFTISIQSSQKKLNMANFSNIFSKFFKNEPLVRHFFVILPLFFTEFYLKLVPLIFYPNSFVLSVFICTFASSVLAKPLHNAQIVRGVFLFIHIRAWRILFPLQNGLNHLKISHFSYPRRIHLVAFLLFDNQRLINKYYLYNNVYGYQAH